MAYNPSIYMPYGQPMAAPMTVQPNWQYQPTQTTAGNLVSVTGIDGARAYQMPPSSRMVLFDSNSDTMYLKSTDAGGFPTLKVFDFHERVNDAPVEAQPAQSVSREEFDALVERVNSLTPAASKSTRTVTRKAQDGE